MIKRLTFLGLAAVLAAGTALAQTSDFAAFRAPLSSSSEDPPVDDEAVTGSVLVLIQTERDSNENLNSAVIGFYVAITTADMPTFTAMHIHQGAAGENGDIVIDSQFGGPVDIGFGPANLFREVTITSSQDLQIVQDIMANPSDYYVNVHSMNNQNGVARGQLESVSFEDAEGGPSHSELSKRLDNMEETLSRVARRLGVVPAGEDDSDDNTEGNQ
jgi:hypothetical protein